MMPVVFYIGMKEVMLLIVIRTTEDGLRIDGHAGYAKTGNDIVCAAVSALAQGLAHSLEVLTDDPVSCRISEGHMEILYGSLSEAGKLLTGSFFIAVRDIQATYGEDYVRIC